MARSPRVPEGPAPAPVVQRLRIRYAKRGRMRFTSTRDFQRALERGVRKAGLPMAFSGGFHPHPKISYANAAPTGAASEAEYVELGLTEAVSPEQVVPLLDAALPDGLDVVEVTDVTDATGPLADELEGSVWAMRFRASDGVEEQVVRAAVDQLLGQAEHHVTRMMKKGPRDIDVRAAVVGLRLGDRPLESVSAAAGDVVVLAELRHTTPTVRPEEVWGALRAVSGVELPRPVSTRLSQGRVGDSGVGDA